MLQHPFCAGVVSEQVRAAAENAFHHFNPNPNPTPHPNPNPNPNLNPNPNPNPNQVRSTAENTFHNFDKALAALEDDDEE